MPDPHIPNLDAISALPDKEIQFYAAVGAVMSLHAGLEQDYFYIFEQATKLERGRAARIFYEVRNASTRREMADHAIRPTLSQEGLRQWEALYNRILGVTGRRGHRNLLGHGRVSHEDGEPGIFDPAIFDDEIFDTGSEDRFFVSEDEIQVLAGKQKPREEGFESVLAYSREMVSLLAALDNFLAAYERGDFVGV